MEITNELKAIEEVYAAIKRGYGFEQMKDKLNLSDEEIISLGTNHPDFMNEINKRYKKDFIAKEEKKEVKIEKKQEVKDEEPITDIRGTAKNLGIKNWYNKSEKKLVEEIALIMANE
jgi:oligoendopeptidase F